MENQCIAYTQFGFQCSQYGSVLASATIRLCRRHWDKYIQRFVRGDENSALRFIHFERDEAIRKRQRKEARQMNNLANQIALDALDQRLQDLRRDMGEFNQLVTMQENMINRELQNFATDRQNVHRTETVKRTLDIIERVLKIPVPDEYRWNMKTCSKTPGEIIAECGLTIDASRTMMNKYTNDNTIYELGKGIYGRVLDCVWQFIKTSPEKKDLCKIMKTEMEDNVGMCEQGNLSRLANVLAGYMEGIGSAESHAEILGREFPKLWDIDDEDERVEAGNEILDRIGIKDNKIRNQWIESLY